MIIGWIVLLALCVVLPTTLVGAVVLVVYIIPSLIVAVIAHFVWWPKNNHKIYLSRKTYSLGVGFVSLWYWVGGIIDFYLKRKVSCRSASIKEYPFFLIFYEDFFVR